MVTVMCENSPPSRAHCCHQHGLPEPVPQALLDDAPCHVHEHSLRTAAIGCSGWAGATTGRSSGCILLQAHWDMGPQGSVAICTTSAEAAVALAAATATTTKAAASSIAACAAVSELMAAACVAANTTDAAAATAAHAAATRGGGAARLFMYGGAAVDRANVHGCADERPSYV